MNSFCDVINYENIKIEQMNLLQVLIAFNFNPILRGANLLPHPNFFVFTFLLKTFASYFLTFFKIYLYAFFKNFMLFNL